MNKIFSIFIVMCLSVDLAFAGYSCNTSKGESIKIFAPFNRGVGASVESKDVTKYYKNYLKFNVNKLKSFIDPDTRKYATEKTFKGYTFALAADDLKIGNIWGLEFTFKTQWNATAILTDTNGIRFQFELSCRQMPDLE